MTHHLTRDELIDSLDGRLPSARRTHADTCAACRAEIASLQEVLRDVAAVDMPEPSPLFWDHLSARIRDRVAEEPPPAPHRGLLGGLLGNAFGSGQRSGADSTAGTAGRGLAEGWRALWWPHGAFAAAMLALCAALGWIAWSQFAPSRHPAIGPDAIVVRGPHGQDDGAASSGGTASTRRGANGSAQGTNTQPPPSETPAATVPHGPGARTSGAVASSAIASGAGTSGDNAYMPQLELAPAADSGDHGHEWSLMMEMAEDVAWEDAEGTSMAVRPGTVERALSELTSDERRTLARLVQAELARPPL